jgi:hypothetical protein
VLRRYQRILPSVACREEMKDLVAELQSELRGSHNFCWGGDYSAELDAGEVDERQGLLGADVRWVGGVGRHGTAGYVVEHVVRGDPMHTRKRGPLNGMGQQVRYAV